MFFIGLEEFEKLRDHVFSVEGHRQQAFFRIPTTTAGIWTQIKSYKKKVHKQLFRPSITTLTSCVIVLSDLTTLWPKKMWQEAFNSHRLCKNQRVEEFGDEACSGQLFRETLDSIEKKPKNTKISLCKICI